MAAVHGADQKRMAAHVQGHILVMRRSGCHQLLHFLKGFGINDLKLRHDLGFHAAVAYHAGIAAVFENVVEAGIESLPSGRTKCGYAAGQGGSFRAAG